MPQSETSHQLLAEEFPKLRCIRLKPVRLGSERRRRGAQKLALREAHGFTGRKSRSLVSESRFGDTANTSNPAAPLGVGHLFYAWTFRLRFP